NKHQVRFYINYQKGSRDTVSTLIYHLFTSSLYFTPQAHTTSASISLPSYIPLGLRLVWPPRCLVSSRCLSTKTPGERVRPLDALGTLESIYIGSILSTPVVSPTSNW